MIAPDGSDSSRIATISIPASTVFVDVAVGDAGGGGGGSDVNGVDASGVTTAAGFLARQNDRRAARPPAATRRRRSPPPARSLRLTALSRSRQRLAGEVGAQLVHRLHALAPLLDQHPRHQLVEPLRAIRADVAHARRRLGHVLDDDLAVALAVNGTRAVSISNRITPSA
jgi:hypothetical protein